MYVYVARKSCPSTATCNCHPRKTFCSFYKLLFLCLVPNIRYRPNIWQNFLAEYSFSDETRKSAFGQSLLLMILLMFKDVINICDDAFQPGHDEIHESRERRWRALQSHPPLVPGSLAGHGEGRVLSALLLERLLPEA
jgi:hypothetical protein